MQRIARLAGLLVLCAASSVRAQQHPYTEYPELSLVGGRVVNEQARFSVFIPPTYIVDKKFIEHLGKIPGALGHGWGFIDSTTKSFHVTLSSFPDGQMKIDEASWRHHADEAVSLAVKAGHKAIAQSVDWSGDSASYRVLTFDPRFNRYQGSQCVATNIGKLPSVVCVNVLAPVQNLSEDVLSSLHFIGSR